MDAAIAPAAAAMAPPGRYSFAIRAAAALLLVALADALFWEQRAGATLGLFALATLALMAATNPSLLSPLRAGRGVAAASTLFFAVLLVEDPSLLAFLLFWGAAAMAALLPRAARFRSAWLWGARLLIHHLALAPRLYRTLATLARSRRRPATLRLGMLVLPIGGSTLFLALFASANPLIGDAIGTLRTGDLIGPLSIIRFLFWLFFLLAVAALLRPRLALRAPRDVAAGELVLPGVDRASVTLSLLAFNALFALQNGLDLAFLWSGAPLPEGMTLADYAHRGAYPLIATALLAGLFVLLTTSPGSALSRDRRIRALVYLWIGQNVLLVASTMLRTIDYVDAYSLTRLRIAALLWMGLVAVGLVLICVRLWRHRSGTWLINANAAAALLLLAGCSLVDLGRVAAGWNVAHAREAGGRGAAIDLCYLDGLGASALVPLARLETQTAPSAFRARVATVRIRIMDRLARRQADWHGWTWRGARRLAAAEAIVAAHRLPRAYDGISDCDGRPMPMAPARPPVTVPAPPPPPPPPPPLTGPAR